MKIYNIILTMLTHRVDEYCMSYTQYCFKCIFLIIVIMKIALCFVEPYPKHWFLVLLPLLALSHVRFMVSLHVNSASVCYDVVSYTNPHRVFIYCHLVHYHCPMPM